jgi:hypothetical protein
VYQNVSNLQTDRLPCYVRFSKDAPVNVEEFRARLRKMTDAQLLGYGKAARNMCSPIAYFGKAPRETFVIQLRECRAEWKRRKAAVGLLLFSALPISNQKRNDLNLKCFSIQSGRPLVQRDIFEVVERSRVRNRRSLS